MIDMDEAMIWSALPVPALLIDSDGIDRKSVV